MEMRRKTLAKTYDVSLRTVDNVLKLMRQSGYDIPTGSIVLVDSEDFGWALKHRDELRERA